MTLSKKITLLLIEDDEIEIMKFQRATGKLDFPVEFMRAENGEKALSLLREEQRIPDVIFLDLNMPAMGGIEFLSILKNDAALKYIPTMILSTSQNNNDIKKCYEIGISGYLMKPLKYEDYLHKIKIALEYWTINELFKKS